jgi:DNA-binding MarR family transcriptional regulator
VSSKTTTRAPAVSKDQRTMGRTAAWLAKQVEIGLASADLSPSQYRVLGLLDEHFSAVSSDLAERLAVRPPSVTAIIDGLVGRGLVERRNVAADRRQVDHVLTPAGRRTLDTADRAVSARLCEIAACLDDDAETAQACNGLLVWRKAFSNYRLARSAAR